MNHMDTNVFKFSIEDIFFGIFIIVIMIAIIVFGIFSERNK